MECTAYSSNPPSSVDMDFFINDTKQSNIISQVIESSGSDSGVVQTFVFTFTTDRNQNGMIVRCVLLWKGDPIHEKIKGALNITCE